MTHNLLVVGLNDRVFNFAVENNVQTSELMGWLVPKQGVAGSFHLTLGGVPLGETDVIPCGEEWRTTLIRAHPVVRGGKGGFGALIRAVGNRANRGNNKEACRDLSGRRLRDINAQKKASKWLEDEPERKKKRREEKRKRLQQKKIPPKHFFNDQAYMQQLRANEEDMDSALKQGLVASSSKGLKRKQPVPGDAARPSGSKKAKLWMGGEEDDISSEGDSEDEHDSRQSDQYAAEGAQGSSSSSIDNSAGSSDETAGNKPSDEEEVEGEDVEEQCMHPSGSECNGTVVSTEIHIPPLERVVQRLEQNDGTCDSSTTVLTAEVHSPLTEEDQQTCSVSCEAPNADPKSMHEQTEGNVTDKNESQGKKVVTEAQSGNLSQPVSDEQAQPSPNGSLDLEDYSSAAELESVGAERLKSMLQSLGLKCGGTLQERAQRLFSTKGKSQEELDPSLFAKAGKSRKRKNNCK